MNYFITEKLIQNNRPVRLHLSKDCPMVTNTKLVEVTEKDLETKQVLKRCQYCFG